MAKSKLNEQQRKALIVSGVVVMILIIAVITIQSSRQEPGKVEIQREDLPLQAIPSEIARDQGAKSALDYLNTTKYWSGDVGASIDGTIAAVDPENGIVIFTAEDGTLYYTRITDMTDLYVGDAMAALSDFQVGMPITVSYEPYYVDTTAGA